MHPPHPPIGLHLARVARAISRAFEDALAEAGGSTPVWLILLNLKIGRARNQRELAAAIGIREATLTHHLNSMDGDGLIIRRRDPSNRRIHLVEMTDAGDVLFLRLRTAAMAFDARLRQGLSESEVTTFEALLDRLGGNVTGEEAAGQFAGVLE